jgi:phage/conjugal plasmid C-4 type zinc finger TraR family protein
LSGDYYTIMNEYESYQHTNIEETEMGQLHALHLNSNAIAAVQARMPKGESLEQCEDCGDDIPEQRRLAAKGCIRCIHCQTIFERNKPA